MGRVAALLLLAIATADCRTEPLRPDKPTPTSPADLAAPVDDLAARVDALSEPRDLATTVDLAVEATADLAARLDLSPVADLACAADVQNDAANCGFCGHDCLGGACTGGVCQPFAISPTAYPEHLALSGGFAYWIDYVTRAVMRSDLSGAATDVLVNNPTGYGIDSLVADDTSLFWTIELPHPTDSCVMSANVDGSGVTTMLSGLPNLPTLAIDTDAVFVDDAVDIRRIPRDGSPTSLVTAVSGSGERLWVDASSVYFDDCAYTGCSGFAVPKDGSAAPSRLSNYFVAVSDSSVFFLDPGPGNMETLLSQPKSGTTATTLATVPEPVGNIAADSADIFHLYFLESILYRLPVGGGNWNTMAVVATGGGSSDLAIDAKRVAFIAGSRVWVVAR